MKRRTKTKALLAACCLAGTVGVGAASPPVKVTLRSSWPAPPPLLEFIETVSLENPDAFFPLVDRVTDPDVFPPQELTAEAVHQFAMQMAAAGGFLSAPGALAAVEMSLALHAATPKIEAFYHHAHTQAQMADPGCGSWVDWYGEAVCDVQTLAQLAGVETIDPPDNSTLIPPTPFARPKLLPFDHVHPSPARTLSRPPRTAIFYASLGSPNFRELHSYLYALADKSTPSVEYVLRPVPEGSDASLFSLSGYGVSLDLKKMDYLALDDRHASSSSSASAQESSSDTEAVPTVDPIIALLDETFPEPELTETSAPVDGALSEEAIASLGFQATQLIASAPASDKLSTLRHLAQNFPKYMPALARRVAVNDTLRDEVHANQLKAQAGVNVFWLNGDQIREKELTPLGFLRRIRRERGVVEALGALGLERTEARGVLAGGQGAEEAGVGDVFDASDRLEEGGVVIWWNDIEKDSRYASWGTSIHGLLRPLYPGQFHNIKRNLYNVVLVLDLSQPSSVQTITGAVASIIGRGFPFRFGVVPAAQSEDGAKMARLFYYSVRKYGRKRTMGLLKQVMGYFTGEGPEARLDWTAVESAFDELRADAALGEDAPAAEEQQLEFSALVRGGEDGDAETEATLEKERAYADRLGASGGGQGFVNGRHLEVDENFWRVMQGEIAQQLQHLQEALYGGKISDETTFDTYFYDLPTSSPRRNKYIFTAPADLRLVDLTELFGRAGVRGAPAGFVYPPETEQIPLTVYVVADFDTEAGLGLLKEALLSVDAESKTRVSFLHNPSTPDAEPAARPPVSWFLSHLLARNLLSKASAARLLRGLGLEAPVPVTPSEGSQIPLAKDTEKEDLTEGVGISGYSAEQYAAFVRSGRLVARELQLAPGQQGLLVNGRVIGPIAAGDFVAADFKTLESYELRARVEPVIKALETIRPTFWEADRATTANLISMCTSVLAAMQAPEPNGGGIFDAPKRPRQRSYLLLEDQYSSFEFGDNSTALYEMAVLVDPVSETAQKWGSLLEWISHIPDVYIKVYMNPATHQEIPLKRFYRYTLLPTLAFDAEGAEILAQAVFDGLPIEPIYTLGMDVPPSWLVRPREALYDLDNIQLGNLAPQDSSVDAVFGLDYLVVEGHARDSLTNAPPRGMQLQLLNGDATPVDDTQVVVNLGYLQFKAKPGVFQLEIREGRGRDIFVMESVGGEGLDSRSVAEVGNEIAVTSFEGLTIYPRFIRLPGMETADVLSDPAEEEPASSGGVLGDLASRVMSLFGAKETPAPAALVPVTGQADINIFTVASGLLYERFVSIMILSVLRNTNSTVKFWFIENFLSPSFLEFIPHLAEAYNFQYELVTYKWPSWLRAQKEKQRIIWAYKILFLDVLFPMDLKKVIFVDADQIVRADLKELVDLDLEGAPYGYTPMGDDNTDMEGFRFWKTGYWKDFLQGRPYHISALYVIDLVRFRQLAAGDILRGSYQQLSADPGSLANLDQDLPNNLQREVPIFSLPEDWLWCETWCSKDRLHRAKTIDLCQNPLTKEPKLVRARQIPEWEEYDAEISRFARKLAEDGVIRSRIVAADANALAGGTKPDVKETSSPTDVPPVEPQDGVEHDDAPRDEL